MLKVFKNEGDAPSTNRSKTNWPAGIKVVAANLTPPTGVDHRHQRSYPNMRVWKNSTEESQRRARVEPGERKGAPEGPRIGTND